MFESYEFDEQSTLEYRKIELNKLNNERLLTIKEYDECIKNLNEYINQISIISEMYKNAYIKILDVGTIGENKINGAEILLNDSKHINELIRSVEDLISQIKELKNKYNLEYEVKLKQISNYKKYKLVKKKVEIDARDKYLE